MKLVSQDFKDGDKLPERHVLNAMGYQGDYSFEVFNEDYVQLPVDVVAERGQHAARWLTSRIARRSLPLRPRHARSPSVD